MAKTKQWQMNEDGHFVKPDGSYDPDGIFKFCGTTLYDHSRDNRRGVPYEWQEKPGIDGCPVTRAQYVQLSRERERIRRVQGLRQFAASETPANQPANQPTEDQPGEGGDTPNPKQHVIKERGDIGKARADLYESDH